MHFKAIPDVYVFGHDVEKSLKIRPDDQNQHLRPDAHFWAKKVTIRPMMH